MSEKFIIFPLASYVFLALRKFINFVKKKKKSPHQKVIYFIRKLRIGYEKKKIDVEKKTELEQNASSRCDGGSQNLRNDIVFFF